jgi:hypothetical protein
MKDGVEKYLDSLPFYDISELADYINVKNVRDVNDLAFCL